MVKICNTQTKSHTIGRRENAQYSVSMNTMIRLKKRSEQLKSLFGIVIEATTKKANP